MKMIIMVLILVSSVCVFGENSAIESRLKKELENYKLTVKKANATYIKFLDNAIKKYSSIGLSSDAERTLRTKKEFCSANNISCDSTVSESNKVKVTELEPIYVKVGYGSFEVNGGTAMPLLNNIPCKEFMYTHAPSLLRYKIPKGAKSFRAIAYSPYSQSIAYKVVIDGKKAYKSRALSRYSKGFIEIKVKIPENAKEIDLITDTLGDGDSDHSCWAMPVFDLAE